MQVNEHGLKRYIPADIKREIRQRSKFGCVICRRAFYQYEHIDPEFKDAKSHDPDHICCLCGSCHDAKTRKQFSTEYVRSCYEKMQISYDVDPPIGPVDLHDGRAELVFGGLHYNGRVRSILHHHGRDILRVDPGEPGEPGKINAVFTDDLGNDCIQLKDNEWVGSIDQWDINVESTRITVRNPDGRVTLKLRLEPPGRIVIEWLEMRISDSYVIASEHCYAVGRVNPGDANDIFWMSAEVSILDELSDTVRAIEFCDPPELMSRVDRVGGSENLQSNGGFGIIPGVGVVYSLLGISIASFAPRLQIFGACAKRRSLIEVRDVAMRYPDRLRNYIGKGEI
jgi:hypothetical protein